MKVAVFAALLAVSSLVVATSARADEPKRYNINLSNTRIGTVVFTAGEYKILVHRDEPKVQILDPRTGVLREFAAKVESKDQKFERTEVHSQVQDGVSQVNEICIGGTPYRIDFRPGS